MKEANFSSRKGYWLALIAEQKQSGLSKAEFCRARGISEGSFYCWVSKLKKNLPSPSLIRIDIEKETVPLKVVFQNGVCLHFAKSPEIKLLREIIETAS